MSLATTCPTCSTVFRVVEDQLKVSEGWVRCGQCQQVFNALEGLFDLTAQRSRPAPLTWAPTEPVGFEHDPAPIPDAAAAYGVSPANLNALQGVVRGAAQSGPDTLDETTTARLKPASREFFNPDSGFGSSDSVLPPGARFVDSQMASEVLRREDPPPEWIAPPAATIEPTGPTLTPAAVPDLPRDSSDSDLDDDDDRDNLKSRWAGLDDTADAATDSNDTVTPAFVRDAERRARWQQPHIRRRLMAGAAVLGLGLMVQVGLHWHDRIAASHPSLKSPLSALCSLAGCKIEAPRVLDAIVVDNTTVSRPAGIDAYRLSVLLRNRADFPVAAPHLEVNLTDGQGALIVRKVLSPQDFRVKDAGIAPQTEATWTLDFASGQRRVANYTVAAFYP